MMDEQPARAPRPGRHQARCRTQRGIRLMGTLTGGFARLCAQTMTTL